VRAVIVGSDAGPDERESKYGFLISGGTDRKVRFWDLLRVEASATVSGLAADEAQPRFSTAHPVPGLVVNVEKASGALRTDEGKGDRDRNGKPRVSRAVAIVREQKGLLRGHLDDITDVALLEGLQNMIVSVDRKGCIYVFQ
jgi:phosphoinositide-3-kinase regulatory subunit 4